MYPKPTLYYCNVLRPVSPVPTPTFSRRHPFQKGQKRKGQSSCTSSCRLQRRLLGWFGDLCQRERGQTDSADGALWVNMRLKNDCPYGLKLCGGQWDTRSWGALSLLVNHRIKFFHRPSKKGCLILVLIPDSHLPAAHRHPLLLTGTPPWFKWHGIISDWMTERLIVWWVLFRYLCDCRYPNSYTYAGLDCPKHKCSKELWYSVCLSDDR